MLCLLPTSSRAIDVTACGTVVDATVGVVQADLSCTGAPRVCLYTALDGTTAACTTDVDCGSVRGGPCVPIAVTLRNGARLDLNAHAITGAGVLCEATKRCRVRGSGQIIGAPTAIVGHASLRVSDVDLLDGGNGIYGFAGTLRVERIRAVGNALDAITSVHGPLRARLVVATDNGGAGVYSAFGPLRATDLTASRNGGTGVSGATVRVVRLTAEGNGGIGVYSAQGLVARASTMTENGPAAAKVDVQTGLYPTLRDTVCDYSVNDAGGGSWGVCRFDGAASTTSTSSTTTSTTTTTVILCESSAPACGGRCPSNGTCGTGVGGCECTFPNPPLRDVAAASGRVVGAAVRSDPLQHDLLYAATITREYASLGTDFEAIWGYVHPAQGLYAFEGLDGIVAFAQAHGLSVQGDPLLWHGYVPEYLESLSPSAFAAEVEEHVRTLARRYRGQIGSWIAVNEAVGEGGDLRNTIFLDRLGPGYIADVFTWAHEEDPDALLFYNDFTADGLNAKSDYIYALVQGLLADGVPIHGVGLQMHLGGFFGSPPTTVQANIQRFVDLGLAVNITEMDVQTSGLGSDIPSRLEAQRVIYHDIVAACVAVPGCDTITTWGFTDRYSWIDGFFGPGQFPLPFDVDFAQKPAYFGMADALAGN